MKARFFALAALVLGLASCQQEFDGAATVGGGEVDFQLRVDALELATRAGDTAENPQNAFNSAFGAIDYFQATDWSQLDLRYSLEVYDVADNYTDAVPVKDRLVKIVDQYEPVAFDLRLVPNRNYHFVVFADFVEEGEYAKEVNPAIEAQRDLGLRHSIGDNLGQIAIKYDAINDELTDAYFATLQHRILSLSALMLRFALSLLTSTSSILMLTLSLLLLSTMHSTLWHSMLLQVLSVVSTRLRSTLTLMLICSRRLKRVVLRITTTHLVTMSIRRRISM